MAQDEASEILTSGTEALYFNGYIRTALADLSKKENRSKSNLATVLLMEALEARGYQPPETKKAALAA